jgi:4'-phosphopantetheinyl transferase
MLRIEAGANGKPELVGDFRGPAISFNLSHSGEIALYAFTRAGPVGVDVEVARRPIDSLALARRAFGRDEADRLAQLDPESRELEFLRAWVRHEAAVKLLGTGIGGKPAAGFGPWFADLEIGARAAAAVALAAPPSELRCWELH